MEVPKVACYPQRIYVFRTSFWTGHSDWKGTPACCHTEKRGHLEEADEWQDILGTKSWITSIPHKRSTILSLTSPDKVKKTITDGPILQTNPLLKPQSLWNYSTTSLQPNSSTQLYKVNTQLNTSLNMSPYQIKP